MPLLPRNPKPPEPEPEPTPEPEGWPDIDVKVFWWRYREAEAAGLTQAECCLYAGTTIDCGQLRKLVAGGLSGPEIAALLL